MSTDPSTSLGASEHDLEYGPNPTGARHEHTDIDPSVGYRFAVWLSIAMAISIAIVYGTFRFFEGQEAAAGRAAAKYPLAEGRTQEPPLPNLQTQPFKDIYMLRQEEATKLGSYGVVDKEGGIVRIPIDRAMELMLQRGFPSRPAGGGRLNMVTQDSSAGRTSAPR